MKTEKKLYYEGRGGVQRVMANVTDLIFLNTSLLVASAEKCTCHLDIFWLWWKTYSCAKVFTRLGNLYNLGTIFVENFLSENYEI